MNRLHRIFIVVTDLCSARCKLCSYWKSKPGKYLPLSFIQRKVVPLIKKNGIKATCITGGEPTLHPELPKIIKEINKTNTIITLITNTSHLKNGFDYIKYDVHAWLLSLDASHQSLHSRIRGLDNFNEIAAWPGKIKSENPTAQIAFNCLIQKQNVRDILYLYEFICQLPCEGIFFNVPELKPLCFGRENKTREYVKYVLLDDEELKILKNNLEKIMELDMTRNKLMQGDRFFTGCITYFEYLRGKKVEFNDNNYKICDVPLTSLVVDESGRVLPCFYLPPEFASDQPTEADELIPDDHVYLTNIKEKLLNNQEMREKHCKYCFQFQG